MALTSFSVANYRSFLRPTTLELRPLTLLFGYNSSGKSALLRVLPLLAHSVGEPRGVPLNLESPAVREAPFPELCCQLSSRRQIDFTLSWDGTRSVIPDNLEYKLSILELSGPQAGILPPVVSEFSVASGFPLHATLLPSQSTGLNAQDYDVNLDGEDFRLPLLFRGITPELAVGQFPHVTSEQVGEFQYRLRILEEYLESLRDNVEWLGAVRVVPPRSTQFRGSAPPRILDDGEGTLEILIQDKLQGGPLLARVSRWFENHTRQRLDVTEVAPRYFSLTLGPVASPGVRVNIVDTGEGMAQVLPVLTLGALAGAEGRGESILLIEQPELHLHPALHAPLADYFCELAMLPEPPQTVIETHSENFLQGLQLAILQGRLDPARVGVYWVQQVEEGSSTVDLITFNDRGLPSHWPPGVFAEDTELARRILKERRAKETP